MQIDEPTFTIGDVAKMTGVKISTIRTWESTSGLLQPARSKGRFRLYSMRDVETVRRLREKILVEKVPPRLVSRIGLSTGNEDPQNGEAAGAEPGELPRTVGHRSGTFEAAGPTSASELQVAYDRLAAKLRALYRASAAVSASRDLPQVLQQLLTLAGDLFDVESSSVLLRDETGTGSDGSLKKLSRGFFGSNLPTEFDRVLFRQVAENQGIVAVHDVADSAELSAAAGRRSIRSVLALPLMYSGVLEGVVYLAGASPRDFSADEITLAGAFANIASAAVQNASLFLRIKASDLRYRGLIESSPHVNFTLDGNGEFSFLSPRVRELLGYEPSELLGTPFLHTVTPETLDRAVRCLQGAMPGEGDSASCRLDLVRKDGSVAGVELSLITTSGDGLPTPVQGVIQDLSRLRRAEEELLQRSRELSALKGVAVILSQSLDLDEVMRLALEKVVEITGIEIGLLALVDEESGDVALKVHRGAPPDLVKEAQRIKLGTGIAGRVAVTGDPIHVDNIADDPRLVILASRRMRHQSLICVPLKSKNRVLGTMTLVSGHFRPIAAQDLQLIASVGHLIGGAIENARLHEQSVWSHNERLMMMQDKLAQVTEAQREERKRLARELHDDVVQTIAALVAELETRKVRETGPGALEIDREKKILEGVLVATQRLLFDLRGPFLEGRGLASLLQEELPRQTETVGCEIKLETVSWPEGVPRDVTFHLYRIIQEALANVRKHARANGVEIGLRSDEQHLRVRIRDDGIGFDLGKLMQGQKQIGSFGLAGMRERVNLLGGKLAVDTAPGAGTCITITVPRYWELELGDARFKVLIVDDHALFGQALANLVGAQEQIEVVGVAHSGEEALQLARKLLPDIILMDIHLPDMNGIEVTRAIRSENPSARVLLLTAFDKEHNVLEGLRAGAIGFVSKTCSTAELVRSLQSALRGEHIIDPRIANQVLELFRQGHESEERMFPFDGLTPREIDILRVLAAGKASKEIGRLLNITDKTVRRHISNIYQKLQIYDRAQLALYAVKKGLIEIERDA